MPLSLIELDGMLLVEVNRDFMDLEKAVDWVIRLAIFNSMPERSEFHTECPRSTSGQQRRCDLSKHARDQCEGISSQCCCRNQLN